VASYNDGFVEKVSKYPKSNTDFLDAPQTSNSHTKFPKIDEPKLKAEVNESMASDLLLTPRDTFNADNSSMNAIKFRKIIKRSRKKPEVI